MDAIFANIDNNNLISLYKKTISLSQSSNQNSNSNQSPSQNSNSNLNQSQNNNNNIINYINNNGGVSIVTIDIQAYKNNYIYSWNSFSFHKIPELLNNPLNPNIFFPDILTVYNYILNKLCLPSLYYLCFIINNSTDISNISIAIPNILFSQRAIYYIDFLKNYTPQYFDIRYLIDFYNEISQGNIKAKIINLISVLIELHTYNSFINDVEIKSFLPQSYMHIPFILGLYMNAIPDNKSILREDIIKMDSDIYSNTTQVTDSKCTLNAFYNIPYNYIFFALCLIIVILLIILTNYNSINLKRKIN